jgi:DNA-binding FadR family transcriptional regulator
MSASSSIVLPDALLQEAASQADHLGVSTEQWIEVALSERIRLEKETAEFFAARAARASGRSLREILKNVGDNPPDPGDELED